MQTWRELATLALVGTEQLPGDLTTAPTGSGALDTFLDQARKSVSSDKKQEQLLRLAATLTLSRRAGYIPPKSAPASETAQLETLKPCSAEAGHDLKYILKSMEGVILEEWLAAATKLGLRAPAELLPDLMAYARRNVSFRASIAAILGERGKWLASQNEDWATLFNFDQDREKIWLEGPVEERRKALIAFRLDDATEARKKLEAVWKNEPAAERAQFLGALMIGLSVEDEPFVLQAVEDRSKEVKQAALHLLKSIAGSKWVAEVTAWADKSMLLKKGILFGQKIEVNVSDECMEALATLGVLDPKTLINNRIELTKELYLQEMLSYVPPQHWTQTWGISIDALLKLGTKPILTGWAKAMARFRDKTWWSAWVSQLAKDQSLVEYLGILNTADEFWKLDRSKEPEVIAVLRASQSKDLDHLSDLMPLLKALPRPWSMEVTRLVVLRFNSTLGALADNDYRARHALATIFKRAAPIINYDCPEALTIWPKADQLTPQNREIIDSFCHVVEFRKRMHRNLLHA